MAKKDELAVQRKLLQTAMREFTSDTDHLDEAIRLLAATATPTAVERYATEQWVKKGQMKPLVLDALRAAQEPLTTQAITVVWCADRGFGPMTQRE